MPPAEPDEEEQKGPKFVPLWWDNHVAMRVSPRWPGRGLAMEVGERVYLHIVMADRSKKYET